MLSILISFVIAIFIFSLLYYFFVYTCEKDGNKKYNILNFNCEDIATPTPTLKSAIGRAILDLGNMYNLNNLPTPGPSQF